MKIKVVDAMEQNPLAIENNEQEIEYDEDYNKISKHNVETAPQEEQTIQENTVEEDKTKRIQQLHKCEKCGKMLTLKSLRYSHSKYCGNNNKPTKMTPQPKNQEVIQQVRIPDIEETPIIKSSEEMRRDRYFQRQNEKKESIKRLFANAV